MDFPYFRYSYDVTLPPRKEKISIPYPKSIFFIITNEFCERFTYYGMRTVLVLYLSYQLKYSADDATIIYHLFTVFCYFFPLLGAIIADSWWGKYKTIFYVSIIYAIGSILISATAIPSLNLPQREFTLLGLLLIAIGTGGIKPCVSAFGGDQFVLPEQEEALQRFFALFYFAINFGSFISTFITPILREDVHCFGEESCFSMAFGVPAALMIIALLIFLSGTKFYKIKDPEGENIIVKTSKCIWHAMKRPNEQAKRDHWLDKADDQYDKKFIDDVKVVLQVLLLFVPLPLFWALFDQQGSRWTFQAARMKGDQGGWSVKPDQMQVVNPVLILAFIPLFETVVYPIFAKCNLLKKPLQRQAVGGVLAGISFLISAVIEFQLEATYPVLPVAGAGQLRLHNNIGCDMTVSMDSFDPILIKNMDMWQNKTIPFNVNGTSFHAKWKCNNDKEYPQQANGNISIYNKEATSYTFYKLNEQPYQIRNENVDKSATGDPTIMVSYSNRKDTGPWTAKITFDSDGMTKLTINLNSTRVAQTFEKLPEHKGYVVKVNGEEVAKDVVLLQGGGYIFMIHQNENGAFTTSSTVLNEPNSINILWLIPQYVVMTAGEVMFSISGLEFSFTQASPAMKSLLTSAWLLTSAFGNVIVIIIAEAKFFNSQAYEFLLFAGLMLVDMLIFQLMAMRYKYVEQRDDSSRNIKPDELNGNSIQLLEKKE